ncbi:DUF378 domain-containing protein [Chitiniphilus purpureus]|uniref:DUF378 domain-containing protein n=1 Tax=Chitiniphilus purpureus TaxID=2981137 RepID=A0ABY6DR43_9NEIS|nr:DUF378 domain-containing protein [Chitiniphilus sp. CD1]UXY14383.1 DUF378 domain-containing protein [Chitiniphilus sp. CD1]
MATTSNLTLFDWITLILLIIGGLNWGLVGAFEFDLVAALFGALSPVSRAVYVLVGVSAVYWIVVALTKLKTRNLP